VPGSAMSRVPGISRTTAGSNRQAAPVGDSGIAASNRGAAPAFLAQSWRAVGGPTLGLQSGSHAGSGRRGARQCWRRSNSFGRAPTSPVRRGVESQ
jgi:hypothetical protein